MANWDGKITYSKNEYEKLEEIIWGLRSSCDGLQIVNRNLEKDISDLRCEITKLNIENNDLTDLKTTLLKRNEELIKTVIAMANKL